MSEEHMNGDQAPLVVVADDDPAIRAATVRICRQEGLRVEEAANGVEAVSLIRRTLPDLVLLDVDLGDMDGRDVCHTLHREPGLEATFFVMISGTAVNSEDRVYGLEGGADGYIVRPISNDELRAWVRAYLRIQRAERTRRAAEQALERASRLNALGTLAAGAGHEIANPLMGLLNYAQLIQDRTPPDSDLRQFADGIVEEGGRIKVVIDIMRQLESVKDNVSGRTDLARLVPHTVGLLERQHREGGGIAIDVSVPDQLWCGIPQSEVVHILTLLLLVARDALEHRQADRTDPKSIRVVAETGEPGGTCRVIVKDTSDGMPPDACAAAFDPFFSHAGRDKDDGLRLPVAYRRARAIGGDLTVEGTPGQGNRFVLTLPGGGGAAGSVIRGQ